MPSPHLIHIGFPKAGSTFLQEWFTRHPEICHTQGGIGGFQDVYGLCGYGANSVVPESRCFVTSCERLSQPQGDVDVEELARRLSENPQFINIAQERVCTLLQALFPNGHILIVTRGFRGMFESGYSQLVRTGTTVTAQETFSLFRSSVVYQSKAPTPLDFDYVIDLYSRAFGAERVIVLPYELLRDDQRAFLSILEERLGLSPVELKIGRVNPSLSPAELYWYPRISRRVRKVANRLGARGARKVNAWHKQQTLHNRWWLVIKLLERRWPDKKVTRADFADEAIESCRGKADSLRGNPLYAPYGTDYLWD